MKTKSIALLLTAGNLLFAAASRAGEDYVAHEWGTFTSVQGADGIQLQWNPLSSAELPGFVHQRSQPAAGAPANSRLQVTKSSVMTLQRLETPVIYFYSDRERTVDVTVNFPQGTVTEWYPQIRQKSSGDSKERPLVGPSVLRWDKVQLLPWKQHAALAASLPADKSGSHYYAARDTDADLLRVLSEMEPPAAAQSQQEKFLFYRGVGNFQAPLNVTLGNDGDDLFLRNTGTQPLRHLFIYSVRQGQGKFLYVESLGTNQSKSVKVEDQKQLVPLSELRAQIAERMKDALVKEGLYAREAAAMVRTWDDSWFEEQGLRVLYTLPVAWTDRILPLVLDPAPREIVRVMVGRAELITPAMEWALMKQVVRYSEAGVDAQARAITETRQLGMGRFLEPAARRLMSKMASTEFNRTASELLGAASKPSGNLKRLASN